MPGLVAFRRRWSIGSDDLVFPGMAEVLFRAVWLITIAVVFHNHKSTFQCPSGDTIHAYYIGMLVNLSVHILLSLVIVRISMSGTISNATPRKNLPIFLYVKMAVVLPELAWIILGTVWAFTASRDCDATVVLAVKIASASAVAAFFAVVIGLVFVFDPLGSQDAKSAPRSSDAGRSKAKKVWEYRCKLLLCCAGADEHSRNAFNDIADNLAKFFEGLDVVPTDIAAGLILLQMEQQRQPHKLHLVPIEATTSPDLEIPNGHPPEKTSKAVCSEDEVAIETSKEQAYTPSFSIDIPSTSKGFVQKQPDIGYPTPQSWMEIGQMTHYMAYAMASYGWPLYKFRYLCTGCCSLWPNCRCCSCSKVMPTNIISDNCCMCNTAAILSTTHVHDEDIVYASFNNKIYQTPYFVALDHQEKSVVISVRGTLSISDAMTDLTFELETISEETGFPNSFAHKGIFQAARFVKSSLENLHILDKAFQVGQGYKLVITGHSLGAGVASCLSILLRRTYPNLQCFAYSPPGGMLSLPVSRYTEDFICSVVLGKDLIPRLSVRNLEDLRLKLITAVKNCELPKYRILACACCAYSDTDDRVEPITNGVQRQLLGNERSRTGLKSYGSQSDIEGSLQEGGNEGRRSSLIQVQLHTPGCIMFIDETDDSSHWFRQPNYVAAWTRAEAFSEIIVSPKMLTDHLPDMVFKALQQLNSDKQNPRYNVHIDQTEVIA